MIQAVLNGKSKGYEYTEDILTSIVFGTLKYLRPDAVLIPFIESAFLYDEKRTPLWQKLNSEGIELRCYREIEYVFWTKHPKKGEPDLILVFKNHIHDDEDFLLVVEAKFKSPKSGTEDKDQLMRYYEAISDDIEQFSEPLVSGFKGKKGFIVYLTESKAYLDISASNKLLKDKDRDISGNLFHLRWHQLYKTFEMMYSSYSTYEKSIVDELMAYMDKVGLRDFSGISLPDDSLLSAFLYDSSIFYNDVALETEKKTYFDLLTNVDFKYDKNIFFRG